MTDKQVSFKSQLAEILLWLKDMACGWDIDNGGDGTETEEQYTKAIEAILSLIDSKIPKENGHTKDAEVHFESREPACCARTEGFNMAIKDIKKELLGDKK